MWWFQHSWWTYFSRHTPTFLPYLSCVSLQSPQFMHTPFRRCVPLFHCSTTRLAHNCPSANLRDLSFGNREICGVLLAVLWELREWREGGRFCLHFYPTMSYWLRSVKDPLASRNVQMRSRYHSYGSAYNFKSFMFRPLSTLSDLLECRKYSGTKLWFAQTLPTLVHFSLHYLLFILPVAFLGVGEEHIKHVMAKSPLSLAIGHLGWGMILTQEKAWYLLPGLQTSEVLTGTEGSTF